jgi:cation diffusion facilitator family transporter
MTAALKPAMRVQTLLKLSVAAALITILMKSAAWWLTDSVGLLSDAMESFVNLASALFAILMVTIAARPADDDHPSGHSKAEYFSSGFEGLLIMGAAVGICWAAIDRFMHPSRLQALGWGIALSLVSSAINGVLARHMLVASREHHSIALEADARHLMTDVWTSAGVVLGLVLVQITGWLWIDPLLAVGVAINILREGLHLAWRSVEGLMDSAVEPDVRTQIDTALAQFAKKSVRFDHVVTRRAGQRRFVDMHMHTPDHWTLGHAAELRNRVEEALMQAVPGLRASIQLLPMHLEAHCHTAPDDLPA